MKKQKNYPLDEVQKISTIYEILELADKQTPENIAFKYKEKDEAAEVSYSLFKKKVEALVTALRESGFGAATIACIGDNSFNWLNVFLAGLCFDGVFVPIDKDLPENDIMNVINHSDTQVIFCDARFEDFFRGNREGIPNVKKFVSFGREEDEGDFLSYNKFIGAGEGKQFTKSESDVNKMKMLVYTSGTTGLSKGVMLSEHNLVSCVYHGLRVSTVFDTCLSVLPYHHTYEAVCGILVSLHKHSTICINENLRTVLPNLSLYSPSYIMLVPAFTESFYNKIQKNIESQNKTKAFAFLIKLSNFLRSIGIDMRRTLFKSVHKVFGGRLKKLVCGGAPIRPEIGEFFDAIGINLINGYGITECSPLVSCNRDFYNDPETVGVKLPCIEIRLDDINEDGIGEICVKGDTVMLGYYKNEEQTKEALQDGWFYTGDYGRMNEEGQLYITGRKKNVIVLSNGKNIYPEELENYISALPSVEEVVVYAPKGEHGDEKYLCAEVFPAEGADAGKIKEQIKQALKELPAYKQIKEVIIRKQEFEKTTSRKIKRAQYNQ